MIGKAIIKAQYNKQVPLTLVAMSVLTAMSIACQNRLTYAVPEIYVGPLIFTLWFWRKEKTGGKVLVK